MKRHPSFEYRKFDDYIIDKLCDSCHRTFDRLSDGEDECPDCGGELLNETALENQSCVWCNAPFDMWDEDVWQHKENEHFLCDDCLTKL